MPKIRPMLYVLLVLVMFVFFLWALYALDYEGTPRAIGAFARVTIASNPGGAPFVVQALDDRGAVLVALGLEEKPRITEQTLVDLHDRGALSGLNLDMTTARATRIDLASGAATSTRVENPFDRRRFVVYDEVGLNVSALSTRFSGFRIPRPIPILFNIMGDGAGTIAFDDALTGKERLIRTGGSETLLMRTLINGRDFSRSHRARLSTFQSDDASLLVCLYSTTRGTTVWLFHNDTPRTQER